MEASVATPSRDDNMVNAINDPLILNRLSVDTLDDGIASIERELNNAMSDIAHLAERKYVKFVPEVVVENGLLNKLKDVLKGAQQAQSSCTASIDQVHGNVHRYQTESLPRMKRLSECQNILEGLIEIEESMVRLMHTSVDGDEDGALVSAKLIAQIEKRISAIDKDSSEVEDVVMTRIYPPLIEELETMKGALSVYLSTFMDNLYNMSTDNTAATHTLNVFCQHPNKVSKHLSAMQTVGQLDGMLAKLCTWLVRNMCWFIVNSQQPLNVFSLTQSLGALIPNREYRIRTDLPTCQGNKKQDLNAVFKELWRLFDSLGEDLEGVVVNERRLSVMIGKKISTELVDLIVNECLTPAVPYTNDDKPFFDGVLQTANEFHQHMVDLGFFTPETITLQKFADSYNTVFINRRCTALIVKARALINASLLPMVTVGVSEAQKRETTETFKKANSFVGTAVASKHCPSLMQLVQCQVSESCVNLLDMVCECLKESGASDSEVAAGRLCQTALNMVQLFAFTAPTQHAAQLSSVPLIAAVFYNNCHYICHRLMTASIELYPSITKAMKGASCGISLVESLPRLRKVAAEVMETQLTQCRRQISTILNDEHMFVGLNDGERLTQCEKTLQGCILHIEHVANAWKEVLTETVYGNALGNITSYMLSTLDQYILQTVDIRAIDAQVMVSKMHSVVRSLEQFFNFGKDESSMHRFAETAYYRTKEVVFVLDAGLEEVGDRWCNGKGPMAQWLNAVEVRNMIKALFQNTTKRAHVLATIKQ